MDIEASSGPELVPEEGDFRRLGGLSELFRAEAERLDGGPRRALYWALRLMNDGQVAKYARQVPGFRYAAFGFLDPRTEANDFGVTLVTSPAVAEWPWVSPEELLQLERPPTRVGAIEIESKAFPVYVTPVVELRHSPPDPVDGTAACWASSRITSSKPRGPGVLTAKHVVRRSTRRKRYTPMSCGCKGHVIDEAPDGIDAALLVCSCASRKSGPRANVPALIAPWTDYEFSGAASGSVRGKVTKITDTSGIITSQHLPIRLWLSSCGTGGDSGALVKDSASGSCIGLYIGGYTDPAGGSGGLAQHLYQTMALMDMEIYL